MAVDTRTKRTAMMHLFGGFCPLPVPDGTIAAGDRMIFLNRYSGLTTIPPPTGNAVPVRYITSGATANIVPVETVTVWAPGVVYVSEQVGPENVVPVREAPTETPRVKVKIVQ